MIELKEDFINEIKGLLGEEELQLFLDSYKEPAKRGLRCRGPLPLGCKGNRPKGTDHDADSGEAIPWEPRGHYISSDDEAGKTPLHSAGAYYIQEPSAMAPVSVLLYLIDRIHGKDAKSLRVLDLCGAPGGKTTQLAGALSDRAMVVANEIHPQRAGILSENVERMGLSNVLVISSDPVKLVDRFMDYFDAILLDAPCSGEGMFRKDPQAINEWSLENVEMCAERQRSILECAGDMLAEGGCIVYSTCTFNEKENEGNIINFIKNNDRFEMADCDRVVSDCNIKGSVPGEYGIRLWPHRVKGEGHFLAPMIPKGTPLRGPDFERGQTLNIDGEQTLNKKKRKKGMGTDPSTSKLKLPKEFIDFWKDFTAGGQTLPTPNFDGGQTLDERGQTLNLAGGQILNFGDYIYIAPAGIPDLSGLKVLRCGLCLGNIRKGRFIPSHALALWMDPMNYDRVYDISNDTDAAIRYLKGETLIYNPTPDTGGQTLNDTGGQTTNENCLGGQTPKEKTVNNQLKGWVLIAYKGFSLGWGKINGSVIKNHYPKGLRV